MQTSYQIAPANGLPGMKADLTGVRCRTGVNDEGAAVPFGVGVIKSATGEKYVKLPTATGQKPRGILMFQADVNPGLLIGSGIAVYPDATTGVAGYPAGAIMTVGEAGRVYVLVEEAVAEDDPVYIRYAANGAGKLQRGAFRKSVDGATVDLVKGARFVGASFTVTINGIAQLVAPVAFDADVANS